MVLSHTSTAMSKSWPAIILVWLKVLSCSISRRRALGSSPKVVHPLPVCQATWKAMMQWPLDFFRLRRVYMAVCPSHFDLTRSLTCVCLCGRGFCNRRDYLSFFRRLSANPSSPARSRVNAPPTSPETVLPVSTTGSVTEASAGSSASLELKP